MNRNEYTGLGVLGLNERHRVTIANRPMSLNEYQDLAARTAGEGGVTLVCGALGLTGEAGEVADLVKKQVFHRHPWTAEVRDNLIHELGDVLWYLATTASTLGVTLDEVAQRNIAKLEARYPEGFSTERSLNRGRK